MAKEYNDTPLKWITWKGRRIPIYAAKPFDMPGGPGAGHKVVTEDDFDDVKGIEVDEEEQYYEKLLSHTPVDMKRFENILKRLDKMDGSAQWDFIRDIEKTMSTADEAERKKLQKLLDKAYNIID